MLAQAVGGPKFRGLEDRKKLTQNLISKHCVPLISGVSSSVHHL